MFSARARNARKSEFARDQPVVPSVADEDDSLNPVRVTNVRFDSAQGSYARK